METGKQSKTRYLVAVTGLALGLLLLMIWNLSMGSTSIPASHILEIIASRGGGSDGTYYDILWNIRLPRILAGVMLGGALSVSGYLLQTFFANPIAGPYVLGISSGAKLTVALAMVLMLGRGMALSSLGMTAMAFLGSLVAMGFVLLLSNRVRNMSMLVVIGVMIGYICSAITDFVVTFAEDSNIVNLHNWSMGSLSGLEWEDVRLSALLVAMGFLCAFLLSKPIGAYRLGETYARSMGVNIRRLRLFLILISSLLSGVVTAFAGPISFVGIAVPHLIRSLIRSDAPIRMIPATFLGGSLVTVLCDGIARSVFAPTELSISSVTALFLVPVVICMMVQRKGAR